MFWNREAHKKEKEHRKKAYERVYFLHEKAEFLCYINDAYMEKFDGADRKSVV